MSMIRCDGCKELIDSDDDPGCFVEVGNMRAQTKDMVLCEPCRERLHDEVTDPPDRDFTTADNELASTPGGIR